MSITAECTACGRRYEAPASMAGKRVRCKQCGNIFALPDASLEEGPDLDALAAVEQSFHSVDATDAGGSAVREGEDDDESGESVAPLRSGRRNMRFSFPLAGELDAWLPRVLLFGGIAWLAWFCIKRDTTGVAWMPYVRLATALIAFFVFVAPITHIMIRKAGKQLGYQMPTGDRFRSYAAYLPAFALGYALWVGGGGRLSGLILGCVAGVALATLFLWFFFRLAPAEIAPSAMYAVIGFFVGLSIVGAIYFAINALLLQAMVSMKNPDLLPASPFGPSGSSDSALPWMSPEERDRLLAEKAKEAKPAPTPGPVSPLPDTGTDAPPAPVLPAIVRNMQTAPVSPFDEFIRPLADSGVRATTKQEGPQITVNVWNADPWRQMGTAVFSTGSELWENRYILSPDGALLGRGARFPALEVQITNLAEQRVTHRLPLTQRGGTPELVGFLDARRILIRWQSGNSCTLEIRNITTPTAEPTLIDKLPPFELDGSTLVFGRGGSLVAIATKIGQPAVPTLVVYSLETGNKVSEVRLEMDASFPVKPTGMDFSADGTQVAVLFEQAGNSLLVSYRVDREQGTKASEIVNPAGLIGSRSPVYQGSALQWLPDGKNLLLYGNAVFNMASGRRIDALEVTGVERCWVWGPDRVELVSRDGPRQYRVVRLDMAKIAELTGGR